MLEIDLLRADDLPAALALSTQAGWNQTPADWKRILDLAPGGCFAGRLDGRLVATATSAAPTPGVHWIGMVLVDRDLRGKGYGLRILERAVEHAKRAEGVGLDATDLGRPLYLKMGFHDVAPIDRWGGALREGAAVDTRRLSPDRLVELDRAALGVDRGPLLRHLAGEADVLLVEDGEGYAIARPGRTCAHLGPVVAPNTSVLSSLLGRMSRLLRGVPVIVDVPRSPALESVYAAHGLAVQRRLMRMTWGAPRPLLLSPQAAAAVSFEWG